MTRTTPQPAASRLTINIRPDTKRAIDRFVEREGVSVTDAVRRLVGYGDLLYQRASVDEDHVLIRRGDEVERIVLI